MVQNTRVKRALSRKQVGVTPVSNLTPGIHTSLTPVLTRQNSTRDDQHDPSSGQYCVNDDDASTKSTYTNANKSIRTSTATTTVTAHAGAFALNLDDDNPLTTRIDEWRRWTHDARSNDPRWTGKQQQQQSRSMPSPLTASNRGAGLNSQQRQMQISSSSRREMGRQQ